MNFKERLMGEVLDFYDHIRVPLSSMERATRQGPYRYYGAQSVIDYVDDYLFDGEYVLVAEDGANLVTRSEPVAFLVNGQFWVNNHAHIVRGKERIVDNYYISTWLNSTNISGFITGAAQPKLSQRSLKQIKIALPAYEIQRRIADILSAYDDLIENNTRRMKLLEDAARLLYEEWFVRLRFPGYEHVKVKDSVPEGWAKVALGDVLLLQRGFDLPSHDRKDGPYPIYASTGVNGCHSEAKVKGPGVVTGRSGSLGTVNYVNTDYWPLNTTLWVTTFKMVSPIYAVFLLRSLKLDQYNGGVSVPTLDRKVVHRISVLVPPTQLHDAFVDFVAPLFRQTAMLESLNEKLREARDLLLPRLMSGEIAV